MFPSYLTFGQTDREDDSNLASHFLAPLWYQEPQWLKNQALQESQSFEGSVTLSQEALMELEWWSTKMNLVNGYPGARYDHGDGCIYTGVGSCLQGCSNSGSESEEITNYLELLAATFAVKTFTKDNQNVQVHLCMDNRTVVFYGNRMRGTRSPVLSELAIHLWQWCLERNTIPVSRISDNCMGDEESRVIQSSAEWQLHQGAFQLIMTTFGSCTVDLFASRLNAQLKHFVSWRPDPNTIGTDAYNSRGTGGQLMHSHHFV